jgi:hypothetical protein
MCPSRKISTSTDDDHSATSSDESIQQPKEGIFHVTHGCLPKKFLDAYHQRYEKLLTEQHRAILDKWPLKNFLLLHTISMGRQFFTDMFCSTFPTIRSLTTAGYLFQTTTEDFSGGRNLVES